MKNCGTTDCCWIIEIENNKYVVNAHTTRPKNRNIFNKNIFTDSEIAQNECNRRNIEHLYKNLGKTLPPIETAKKFTKFPSPGDYAWVIQYNDLYGKWDYFAWQCQLISSYEKQFMVNIAENFSKILLREFPADCLFQTEPQAKKEVTDRNKKLEQERHEQYLRNIGFKRPENRKHSIGEEFEYTMPCGNIIKLRVCTAKSGRDVCAGCFFSRHSTDLCISSKLGFNCGDIIDSVKQQFTLVSS